MKNLPKKEPPKNLRVSAVEKIKWREIRFNWTASTNTLGENFTLAQLYEQQGVTPFQYYLYGLGIGNGYRNRGLWNIVSGDMARSTPSGISPRCSTCAPCEYPSKM